MTYATINSSLKGETVPQEVSLRLPLSTLVALLSLAPLAVQVLDRRVGGRLGILLQNQDERGADNPLAPGASAGAWFSERWGGDLSLHFAKVDFTKADASGNESAVAGSALFNLRPQDRVWTSDLKAGLAYVT